jgi:ribosomal protein S18 acetylase RimI-like enzyme
VPSSNEKVRALCWVMARPALIRTMSRAELDLAVDWAAAEGWNPGLQDATAFHAADPGAFLAACRDDQPAACISVTRYGADVGFLGFYIAHPSARGQGYGIQVWRAGMARLAGRNVGLDGVVAQQENYRKSGFTLAWRNIRYEGSFTDFNVHDPGITLLDASTIPFDALAAFDRRFFHAARDAFLSLWISLPCHRARVALRDGEIVGLAVARPCRRGAKIGPLYADDTATALALLAALDRPGLQRPVIIDVPEPNKAAVKLVESFSFTPAFETARMYTGPAPATDMQRLFGVTTFELG